MGPMMPERLAKVTAGTLMVLFLGAAPALAKGGPEDRPVAVLTISGPALDGPILLSGDRVWRVLYLSTFRGYHGMPAEAPARDRLGPGLEARYRFVLPKGNVQTLRQTLYPCATDGKTWSFTGAGQDAVRYRIGSYVQSGWWHSTALAGVVEDLRSACERPGAISGGAVGGGGSSVLWVGLVALALLATIGLLWREAHRRHQPVRA
jgi:hypothetical protein